MLTPTPGNSQHYRCCAISIASTWVNREVSVVGCQDDQKENRYCFINFMMSKKDTMRKVKFTSLEVSWAILNDAIAYQFIDYY